jgi:hypothetical protein
MDLIKEIERWYLSHCNGDWEHGHGIKLQTLDNPGWRLKIYLVDTELESRPFQRLEAERNENDWFQCWVKEGFFEAACGPQNLEEVLRIFIEWSKKSG